MTPYVLGVDPGHVSGWCLFGGPKGVPLDWGQTGAKGRRTTGVDVWAVLTEKCRDRPLCVAVEGQFVLDGGGKGGWNHGKTLSTLKTAHIAGVWEGVSEALGASLYAEGGIQPTSWRSAVWGGRWSTEQAKAHAVKMALHTWGIRILKTHHHTAEALWIASYAHGELAAQQRHVSLGV